MNKLKMQTPNLTDKNIEQIAKLFPNVITETKDENGIVKKAVDFDLLKQTLSGILVEDDNERYRLNWPGKKASLLKANTPITKTLRPVIEDSVDFENTENLYIEGDNFEVLKVLQESYLGKVKMIYIDPPYNTGKDFIYRDNFKVSKDEYEEEIGVESKEGEKLFKNTDSNGRFHSDWLSMMYERLIVARDLLKDDGVIFISIDDNEVVNLRKICDEIYGEENFLAQVIWDLKTGRQAGHFTKSHEYLVVFSKNKDILDNFNAIEEGNIVHGALKKISRANPASEIEFPAGIEFEGKDAIFRGELGGSEKQYILSDEMVFINGKLAKPVRINAGWAMRNQVLNWLKGKETYDTKDQKVVRFYFNSQGILFYEKERGKYNPKTVWSSLATTKQGTDGLVELMEVENLIEFPKPVNLIKHFINFITKDEKRPIVLDFFSGSSTTAHAVMQLNAEDGGNRKFIMVQLPEKTDEKSEAYKAGYKTIAEIGKERIRRAGKKIKEEKLTELHSELKKIEEELEQGILIENDELKVKKEEIENKIEQIKDLDIGFRVYKTDSSSMKDVFYHPEKYNQDLLSKMVSNIKEDRTPEDLLTQVILDLGLTLDLPIEKRDILGNTVFIVQKNALVACFDNDINFEIVDRIAELKPFKVVFKDASFKDDKDRINVKERFKRLSPETVVTVI